MDQAQWMSSLSILACLCGFPLGVANAQPVTPPQAAAAENGLVTVASSHDVADTIKRFETAVRAKGWVIFTTLDHAAAAKAAGLQLRPRTVVVFGNPKAGTLPMRAHPTLAIDLPLKALVWQDDDGKVWLSYNSAEFLAERVYGRHGVTLGPEPTQGLAMLMAAVSHDATH